MLFDLGVSGRHQLLTKSNWWSRNYKVDAATGVGSRSMSTPLLTTKQPIIKFEQALVEEWARAFPEQ
jgi:hypothetical protein